MTRAPRTGDQIADRYELEALLGSGGMSTVFCAHDVQLDRRVTIKILHERFAGEGEYVERFRREARSVAQLAHPNVVTVIDRGEDQGRQFIVFEYVEGENLKEHIVRSAPLPLGRAIELAIAIADGLTFAHEHGLVHRDVKPQNVLISANGSVKVTDFGIARSLEVDHGMTQTGTVVGTGEYIAPEQATGGQVSAGTDVYSLGVVLWEMLTGNVPFEGENFVAVALRHVNEEAPDIRELRLDIPPRLAAALDKALQKDPAHRFPTMRAFAEELRACLAMQGSEGATQVIPARVRHSARTPARRRTWPLAYIALALLVGAAALVAALFLGGGGSSSGSVRAPLRGVASYDPVGQEQEIFGYTAPRATDGDSATAWVTQTYGTQAFGGLKDGLGLVVASRGSVTLKTLTVTTSTPGFTAEIKVGSSSTGPFVLDSASQTVGTKTTFTLDDKSGSYWLVWLTELGPQRTAAISNVTARR
ncbi:MAG: eukaryotic-like serine/threonine-protein kinase [Gaiellaceae bacterium]|jgi:serine/threonine-protein kinase|nr:eukaryotic-like serine/threonine-protein kinase [Gaiellaceae bacterium]